MLRKLLMGRNSYFLGAVVGTALVSELLFDNLIDKGWRWANQGKLFEDVERRLKAAAEE